MDWKLNDYKYDLTKAMSCIAPSVVCECLLKFNCIVALDDSPLIKLDLRVVLKFFAHLPFSVSVAVLSYDCYYFATDMLAGTNGMDGFMSVQAAFVGLGAVAVICGIALLIANCFCEPKATNRGRVTG